MMIKALFFDIDGTLVSFKTHLIPQSTVDAIAEAKRNGVKVYISTGRPKILITNLGQIADLIDGWITTNGALCFIDGEIISCNSIQNHDVMAMLADARIQNYPVIVVGTSKLCIYNNKPMVDEIFHQSLGVSNLDYNMPVEEVLQEKILQLTPFVTVEQEKILASKLNDCILARWHPAFTDVTSTKADKGQGLETIARCEGFCIDETMAFGDGGNDISIIRKAGVGVAMGNAGEDVKASADFVTSSVDDDGIKNALVKYKVI